MERVRLQVVTTMRKLKQSLEQTVVGKLYQKGEVWGILYKEEDEEGGEVSTSIKVEGKRAVILRSGVVRMSQEFVQGKWTEGRYQGPFGSMMMETNTKKVEWMNDRFMLHYQLKLNGEDMGRYEIKIQIVEKLETVD